MNESTLKLINAIESGDAVSIESAFNAAMAEKVAEKLETMRTEVAQSMFKTAVVEEETQLEEAASDPAKEIAKRVASSAKNMKVTSHGDEHYVHQKGDPDGENGYAMVKHDKETGHIHIEHESGVAGGGQDKFHDHAEAEKHLHKIVHG